MTETEYIDHLIGIGLTAEHATSLAREREREVHDIIGKLGKLKHVKNLLEAVYSERPIYAIGVYWPFAINGLTNF